MRKSEQKTFRQFLLLYLLSVAFYIFVVAYFHFTTQKEQIFKEQQQEMYEVRVSTISKLFGQNNTLGLKVPEPYLVALFDAKKEVYFSNFRQTPSLENFRQGVFLIDGYAYYYSRTGKPFLGGAYVIIRGKKLQGEITRLIQKTALLTVLSILFFAVTGYYLSRLFLQPVHRTITLLDNFIKDATHEMNTPVSSILMTIETLRKNTAFDEQTERKIQRIHNGVKNISHIYEDLLFVNFSDKIPVNIANFRIDSLLIERLDNFIPLAESRHISIKYESLPQVSIQTDRLRFTRILDNLISNAIKYNKPHGEIILTLDQNHFSIRDTGAGIPPDKLQFIFQRYKRLDDEKGGFGIGLSIVMEIADLLGLRIEAESKQGEGSIFTVHWFEAQRAGLRGQNRLGSQN